MSKYQMKTPKKVEDAVVGTYHKIEDAVVGAYHKVEAPWSGPIKRWNPGRWTAIGRWSESL